MLLCSIGLHFLLRIEKKKINCRLQNAFSSMQAIKLGIYMLKICYESSVDYL